MKPFTQQGMFMPAVVEKLLGTQSKDTLDLEHRKTSEKTVAEPPEWTAQQKRNAPDPSVFAARCAAKLSGPLVRYPDAYVAAYEKQGQKRKR